MSTTQAISAFGTLLKMGDGATPESFTTIAEITEIGGPALSLERLDATHMQSTGGWKEKIGGLLDGGEVTFSIQYVPTHATHNASTGLISRMVAKSVDNYQLVFPDASSTTWTFAALVAGFEPDAPHDGKLTADVTLDISGQPTLA